MCKKAQTGHHCKGCPLMAHVTSAERVEQPPKRKKAPMVRVLTIGAVAFIALTLAACNTPAFADIGIGVEEESLSSEQVEESGPSRGYDDQIEGWQATDDADQIIEQVAESQYFAAWLDENPGWQAFAETDEGASWFVEFYIDNDDEEEFLGFAYLNVEQGVLGEWAITRPLSAAEFEKGQAEVVALLDSDPEIEVLLGDNPASWDRRVDYESIEGAWRARYTRGIEHIEIYFFEEDGDLVIGDMFMEGFLDEETGQQVARDLAIEIAFDTTEADERLDGIDDWTALAEPQPDGLWTVSFVSGDDSLLFAVVDVENEELVEIQ